MIDHLDGDPTEKKVLTKEEVKAHIEKSEITLVKMSELLEGISESCVDGRCKHGVVGTPGGNAGEFLMTLTAYEQVANKEIDSDQVEEILQKYLDVAGKFYFHSDEGNLAKLGLTDGENITQIEEPARQEELLQKLVDVNNIGCGHLNKMLSAGLSEDQKEDYKVRPELIQEFIKAYFRLLWKGNKNLEFEVLPGGHHNHTEGAVVNVEVIREVDDLTKIPMIKPAEDRSSFFVAHPQAVNFMREQTANNSASFLPNEVDIEKLKIKMQELGNKHLEQTLNRLAVGLPKYTAKFSPDGVLISVK